MPHRSRPTETNRAPRAILVAPRLASAEARTVTELSALLAGLGIDVIANVAQKRTPLDSPHLLGKGKLDELEALVKELREQDDGELLVVVAAEVGPSDQRALSARLEVEILDRTSVILRVFRHRARTKLARLEVDLAQATYELPRVRDDHSLGDREGGGGRAARGHTNVELEKQRLRRRIVELGKAIEAERVVQEQQRKRRSDVAHAALVGYTNAGKSSWMRALTGSEVLVEDRLFATLGTTVRALPDTAPRVVLSDTVGFMRNLPHQLLRSFQSTLEASLDAGLLVHVVDASDPELEIQLQVTEDVLAGIGGASIPMLLLLNKVDHLTPVQRAELELEYPDAMLVSAHDPADVGRVRAAILGQLSRDLVETTVDLAFTEGKRLGQLRSMALILEEHHHEGGIRLRIRAPAETLARLEG